MKTFSFDTCSPTKMLLVLTIALMLPLISFLTSSVYGNKQQMVSKIVKNGEVLIEHYFVKKTVNSITECQLYCLKHKDQCRSFNIIPTPANRFMCELFDVSNCENTEGGHFRTVKGGKHIEVSQESSFPKHCLDWRKKCYAKSGIYTVDVNRRKTQVYCDMETDGGGWTVFQKQFEGTVDFKRNWEDYKNGFGSLDNEFWLGNEIVHQMTNSTFENIDLYLEGTKYDGTKAFTKYKNFYITSEMDEFRMSPNLYYVNGIAPQSEESKADFLGIKFSTSDRDNDEIGSLNCASRYQCGWWFNACYDIKFNGVYGGPFISIDYGGLI